MQYYGADDDRWGFGAAQGGGRRHDKGRIKAATQPAYAYGRLLEGLFLPSHSANNTTSLLLLGRMRAVSLSKRLLCFTALVATASLGSCALVARSDTWAIHDRIKFAGGRMRKWEDHAQWPGQGSPIEALEGAWFREHA